MRASLDTNVIIHLYRANQQQILFSLFGTEIYVYEFLVNQELKNHGKDVMPIFMEDVEAGKITIITDEHLKSKGIYNLFMSYFKEDKDLYSIGDTGEVYAIALARLLGAMSIVTDDIKVGGPHFTLMRLSYTDVVPFSFCEILFLLYLEEKITGDDVISVYESVIKSSIGFSISIKTSFEKFLMRFSLSPYSEKEKEWIAKYCQGKSINFDNKTKTLKKYIKNYIKSKGLS